MAEPLAEPLVLRWVLDEAQCSLNQPDGTPLTVLRLNLAQLCQTHFQRLPATPYALESAIAQVEDEIMRTQSVLPRGAVLVSASASVVSVATYLLPHSAQVPTEVVERAFSHLSAIAEGRPAGDDAVALSAPLTATLLVLRELLHHLACPALQVG